MDTHAPARDPRIILTMALTPALDAGMSPGAYRCLALLRSLAGHARMVRTFTKSLATLLQRTTNTIRAYRDQLEEAGFIWWTLDRRTGVVTVYIREAVEPPSRRARLEDERTHPKPMRSPTRSTTSQGGAKFFVPIKSRFKSQRSAVLEAAVRMAEAALGVGNGDLLKRRREAVLAQQRAARSILAT